MVIYNTLSPGFAMPMICFTSLKTKCVINLDSIIIKQVAYYCKSSPVLNVCILCVNKSSTITLDFEHCDWTGSTTARIWLYQVEPNCISTIVQYLTLPGTRNCPFKANYLAYL